MNGLFINNKKAKDSIYESGHMAYQSMLLSKEFELDYIEIDFDQRRIPANYDFYFFNYHPATMGWMDTKKLKKELGFCITMVLEVAPNDPFVMCPAFDFDVYCVLDPTIKIKNKNVYPFPRPLEKIDFVLPVVENEIPVIGTFGFATKGKGFQHVVEAVNKEFVKAVIKINIPFGDFVPNSEYYAHYLGDICRKNAKPGIDVIVTHDFMSKNELIKWCASNTLNCFLYDRDLQGLSATTDQAIAAGRPIAVSANNTFRHITAYLPTYPSYSLKDSIEKSIPLVKQMAQDWQPERFAEKLEMVLKDHKSQIKSRSKVIEFYTLPLKSNNFADTIYQRIKKYKRIVKKLGWKSLLTAKRENEII